MMIVMVTFSMMMMIMMVTFSTVMMIMMVTFSTVLHSLLVTVMQSVLGTTEHSWLSSGTHS